MFVLGKNIAKCTASTIMCLLVLFAFCLNVEQVNLQTKSTVKVLSHDVAYNTSIIADADDLVEDSDTSSETDATILEISSFQKNFSTLFSQTKIFTTNTSRYLLVKSLRSNDIHSIISCFLI